MLEPIGSCAFFVMFLFILIIWRIVSWNVRGAGNMEFLRNFKELVHLLSPWVLPILEPRISGARAEKYKKVGFFCFVQRRSNWVVGWYFDLMEERGCCCRDTC